MRNAVLEKSFSFAARIVKLCQYLKKEKQEYDMSRQLLRSGTSVGANITESQQAQSRADFVSKLNIALKEAQETDYWLRLLYTTNYLNDKQYQSIITDCREIEYLLIAIVKTSKK